MIEPLTEKEIQASLEQSPFGKFLGLRIVSADSNRGELIMSAQMRPEFERGGWFEPVARRSDRGNHRHGWRLRTRHDSAPCCAHD